MSGMALCAGQSSVTSMVPNNMRMALHGGMLAVPLLQLVISNSSGASRSIISAVSEPGRLDAPAAAPRTRNPSHNPVSTPPPRICPKAARSDAKAFRRPRSGASVCLVRVVWVCLSAAATDGQVRSVARSILEVCQVGRARSGAPALVAARRLEVAAASRNLDRQATHLEAGPGRALQAPQAANPDRDDRRHEYAGTLERMACATFRAGVSRHV